MPGLPGADRWRSISLPLVGCSGVEEWMLGTRKNCMIWKVNKLRDPELSGSFVLTWPHTVLSQKPTSWLRWGRRKLGLRGLHLQRRVLCMLLPLSDTLFLTVRNSCAGEDMCFMRLWWTIRLCVDFDLKIKQQFNLKLSSHKEIMCLTEKL